MAISSLTLGLVLLTAGQVPPSDIVPISKRNFKIPILVEPDKRPQIKLLKLWVSEDLGATWKEAAARTADQDHFAYYAPADGVYWFTVAVVDQQDQQLPADPTRVPPNQIILVDTISPEIKFKSAQRQGEEIVVNWDIREENPDLESLKLEYRPADAPSWSVWYSVPITRGLSGEAHWKVADPAAVTVRMELRDAAENVGFIEQKVPAAPERITAAPASPPPAPVVASTPPAAGSGSPLLSAPAPAPVTPPAPPLAPPAPLPLASDRPAPPAPLPVGRGDSWAMERPPLPGANTTSPLSGEGMQRVVAWSPNTDPGLAAAPLGSLPARAGASGVVVGDPEVSLQYDVKAGPSGISKVELWITEDEGRSWRWHSDDEDKKSPVTTKLPREGKYGFHLVTISGAGLSEGPPRPGDPPDIVLEVDTTPPVVQLYEPKPDPQRPEALVIEWTSNDRNLTSRPVTLEYAAAPGGPWQQIAANQPASGTLSWHQPQPMSHVLLRVTANDTAGNRSVAETREPILVDLNKTRGRIVGIAPTVKKPSLP